MSNFKIISLADEASGAELVSDSKRLKVVGNQFADLTNAGKAVSVDLKPNSETFFSDPLDHVTTVNNDTPVSFSGSAFTSTKAPKRIYGEEVADESYNKASFLEDYKTSFDSVKESARKNPYSIKSDENVGDKANKIRKLLVQADEGTKVYETLAAGVKKLDALDEKLAEIKTLIDKKTASSQNNENIRNAVTSDLKSMEDRMSRIEKGTFDELESRSGGVSGTNFSNNDYMSEINEKFAAIRTILVDVTQIMSNTTDLATAFNSAREDDLEEIGKFNDKVDALNKKKINVCRIVEESLKKAYEADKQTSAAALLEEESKKKIEASKQEAQRLAQNLDYTLSGLDALVPEEPKTPTAVEDSSHFDRFASLRIDDDMTSGRRTA